MQTVCGNCGTPQGPFDRTVLPLGSKKVTHVIIVCGTKRGATKEERNARTRECNERAAKRYA